MISTSLYDDYKKLSNVSYLLFPSEEMKSQTMTVEPYNFTLSYTHLVRSSSMIATFSNQQTMSYLQRHAAVSQPESCYYPLINTKLGACFQSIFSTDIDGNLQRRRRLVRSCIVTVTSVVVQLAKKNARSSRFHHHARPCRQRRTWPTG